MTTQRGSREDQRWSNAENGSVPAVLSVKLRGAAIAHGAAETRGPLPRALRKRTIDRLRRKRISASFLFEPANPNRKALSRTAELKQSSSERALASRESSRERTHGLSSCRASAQPAIHLLERTPGDRVWVHAGLGG